MKNLTYFRMYIYPVPASQVLTGHTANAEFALATSPVAPLVLSGGKDNAVLLWSVGDHVTSLQVGSEKKCIEHDMGILASCMCGAPLRGCRIQPVGLIV